MASVVPRLAALFEDRLAGINAAASASRFGVGPDRLHDPTITSSAKSPPPALAVEQTASTENPADCPAAVKVAQAPMRAVELRRNSDPCRRPAPP